MLTDGFANASNVSVPAYNHATWVGTRPYQTIYSSSLADLASAYYTNNLRPDLPTGLLNVDPSDTSAAADKNPDLHMNTCGVTLGLTGTIYGTGSPAAANPYLTYPNWPAPTQNRHPSWYFDLPGGGERVNTAPTAAFGVLVFSTNQPSLRACSSQSYLYAVDVASGGQLATQAFAVGETPWSGKSLGTSLASRPVIVVLPSGSVQSITHKSDTTLTTSRLPVSTSGKVKKVGWKEIFR